MRKSIVIFVVVALLVAFAVPFAGAAPVQQMDEGQEYVVQASDWLSKIAEKFYGDPLAYPTIVDGTNAKAAEDSSFTEITNPDVIEVGQKLWISAAGEAESMAMAPEAGESMSMAAPANILLRYSPDGSKYGFIDTSGELVIPATFDNVSEFEEGLAAVVIGDKMGLIDRSGQMVVEPQFDAIGAFDADDDLALVADVDDNGNGLYGFINRSGEVVLEPQFALASDFSEGLAAVLRPAVTPLTLAISTAVVNS
jgi:hypothetical protein